ncbi:MAG TPA: tRNA pseudouridine(55) synthase TruB [Gammaproteobacteria bacterium]|jgi:tRNA pseudouridine55 synthase|nr:tRNA pseudouridine(55) synthase TruB [Gammaproteobacteria bacterium]PHS09641.1 MAG: tRNA pseudouridine(55) synthase TruB [Acidithiobacillus sp.]RTZ64034.1 MAG: tRNA pseudouridine(55) synthase TruB [Gammaproteobacteria bacterium]HAD36313.1 tRNA pseudouridine(55) synthase TruB [Gammaproteobacteria bacterium]HBK76885.1 tRNA pseudouridine(55) synthase TruB [Gammaproteobacteria bacterium]
MARRNSASRGDNLSGLLLLDKPQGVTSNEALQEAKRLLNARKAGHTGSLDPIATGLLPLCFGSATKLSGFFLGADKTYWTRIRLGERTATGDSEGDVVEKKPVTVSQDDIEKALLNFQGEFLQTPPMYSAVKMNGTPLYKLARQGIEVERSPRTVVVYTMELKSFDGLDLELELKCSRGFYVRGLAHDLGNLLKCGGHVVALRRLVVADLKIEDAVKLAELTAVPDLAVRQKILTPIDGGLSHLPEVRLSADAAFYLCRGQAVRAHGLPNEGQVRLYAKEAGFLGIGMVTDDGRVTPRRLIPQREK